MNKSTCESTNLPLNMVTTPNMRIIDLGISASSFTYRICPTGGRR
jgi:hypothetical protein